MRSLRAAIVALSVMTTLAAPNARAGADPLAAYRAFVRTPAAVALLASARAAMLAHFDGYEAPASAPIPAAADSGTAWPGAAVGVYVSLVDGRTTRACMGSDVPLASTLGGTVRALAVLALQADRRRPPVRREELDGLRIVLSFAGPGTPLADPMAIAPGREGLLVRGSTGSVAFLPGEARTVAYALREARRIGVIADARDAAFERFDVATVAELPPRIRATRTKDDE